MMYWLSKSFTHYRKGARIEKEAGLKNLRKTYITWLNEVMGDKTGVVTSHSMNGELERHYINSSMVVLWGIGGEICVGVQGIWDGSGARIWRKRKKVL